MADQECLLSVIVTMVGGPVHLRRCLSRLLPQVRSRPIEVIVPFDATAGDMAALIREYPQVEFLDRGSFVTRAAPGTQAAAHELYDRRTAWGLSAARGQVVALLQDFGAPADDWCAQLLAAHRLPHGVIGGAVEHEGQGALNWAVYFLDFGRFQPPLREGPAPYLTDVNVSYKRTVLESVRELWHERYKEVTVNWALARRQVVLWQRPQVVVFQDRGKLSFRRLVSERFSWGRLFGSIRTREMPLWRRLVYVVLSPLIPVVLLARMTRKVLMTRRHVGAFVRALPALVALTAIWCAGEFLGYLTGRESSA